MSKREDLAEYLANLAVIYDFLDDRGTNDPRLLEEGRRAYNELMEELEDDETRQSRIQRREERQAGADPPRDFPGGSRPDRPGLRDQALNRNPEPNEPWPRIQSSNGELNYPSQGIPRKTLGD